MYKLLVVDDEFNIRDGIVNAVPWHTCGVTVSGEAGNGVEALDCVAREKPDLVISDISMDVMDGLEFVERLKGMHPEVKVILLSGYDAFDYAKRALALKVSSYLLKPVSPGELMDTVRGLIGEIESENRLKEHITNLESEVQVNRELVLDRLLRDLTDGVLTDPKELEERLSLIDMSFSHPHYACLVVSIDGWQERREQHGPAHVRILMRQAEALFRHVLSDRFGVWSYQAAPGQIVALLGGRAGGKAPGSNGRAGSSAPAEESPGELRDLAPALERFRMELRRILDVTATIAIGETCDAPTRIAPSHAQAQKALEYRTISGPDSVIRMNDIDAITHDRFRYPADKAAAILTVLSEGDDGQIRDAVHAFFAELESRGCLRSHLRIAVMELFSVIVRKFMDLGLDVHASYDQTLLDPYRALERYDSVEAVRNWLLNIVLQSATTLRGKRFTDVRSVVARVQSYIADNFANPDISLHSIADYAHFNAPYLSKLYKKETGENYLEYLTRLRMEKARQLLRTTPMRTAEVGNAVGYPNPQYFTTLFRKTTGMTPMEYREAK